MRHHPCSPFGRISKAVSAALIGLALGMVATPFAAAVPLVPRRRQVIGLRYSIAEPDRLARSHGHANRIGVPSPSVVTTPDMTASPTPEASVTSSLTDRRSPSPEVVNAPPDVTGVSGFLRDATTGAPIHNGCVAWRPASVTSTATNGTTGIGDKGEWSINTGDPGPFYIAFYVTDDREDCSQAALTGPDNYRASWYRGHPFFGTDPSPLCRHATPIRSPPAAPSWPALARTTPCRRPARSPTEPPRDGLCARETCRSATPASWHWDPTPVGQRGSQ